MGTTERPTKVEIGSRWLNPTCNSKHNPMTVTGEREYKDGGAPRVPGVTLITAAGGERHWPVSSILATWDFLGGPPEEEGRPVPWAVGQRRRCAVYERLALPPGPNNKEIAPAREFTVVSRSSSGYWNVDNCYIYSENWPSELLADAPQATEPVAPPPAAPAHREDRATARRQATNWAPTSLSPEAVGGPGLPDAYACVGNRSALQAIPCRRSSDDRPGPPFVPSIDDDFWLVDAPHGLVGRGR